MTSVLGHNVAGYWPRRINMYVPACRYHAEVVHRAPHRVDFGTPVVGDADAILNDTSAAAAGSTSTLLLYELDAPYGRCLTCTGSAGADTLVVTVRGWDYLGQPMTEVIVAGDDTPTAGVKAFKWLFDVAWTMDATETFDLGFGDKLGLPYAAIKCLSEELDGAIVSTLGTLVTPSRTDPATATTTDPRGTYDPQSTLNGSARLTATFLFGSEVNAAGNGGFFGLPHYYA